MYNDPSQIGYSFWQFKDLALRANHTYQILADPAGGANVQKIEMFNLFKSTGSYEFSLSRQYNQVVHEIGFTLENRMMKIDKLNYLSLILVEIEALQDILKIDSTGNLAHANYYFNNISEDFNHQKEHAESENIQPYLKILDRFLKKLLRYIIEVKENIGLIPQQDFPITVDLVIKPFDSTMEQPDNWFDYLITKNGLQVLKHDFVPSEDDQQYVDHISYNQETETRLIAERDPETGDWQETYTKFSDVLKQILYKEFNKTKTYIDQRINTFPSKEPVSFFLELVITRLKYLFNVASTEESVKKYPDIPGAVKALIRFVYEKYSPYCPAFDEVTEAIVKESKIYSLKPPGLLSLPQASNPGVFRWMKGNSDQLSLLLHGALNEQFIAKIELLEFDQIFKGGNLTKPIRIKWIDRPPNGRPINKVTLLYLFKKLDEARLIDVNFDSKDMFYKLENIFTDVNGDRIENLPQSKASVLKITKPTKLQKRIEEIVNLLISKT